MGTLTVFIGCALAASSTARSATSGVSGQHARGAVSATHAAFEQQQQGLAAATAQEVDLADWAEGGATEGMHDGDHSAPVDPGQHKEAHTKPSARVSADPERNEV